PPRTLLVLWGVLAGGLLLVALVAGTWRRRAALLALLLASIAFTVVPEALSAAEFGYIWQGRYSLPVATGIPILSAWIVGRASWWRPRLAAPITAAVGAIWVLGQLLGQAATLRRYVTGVGRDLFAFLESDGWSPPLDPYLLVGALAVCGLAFVGWAVIAALPGISTETASPTDPGPGQEPTTSPIRAENRSPNASSP
ncbi:MAG TPA: hypothetical protein VIY72_10490, partial [Acidimicrobiales bacterium]